MFVDTVEIRIKAGNGGSGLASFRREKFLPFGGPDGGDGGKGGGVHVVGDSNMEDLAGYKHKKNYLASNGGTGGKNEMHGLNAEDLVLRVPVGTMIYRREHGEELLVADIREDGQSVLIARGGKGGRGNVHFATATRKAPTQFQRGEPGEQYEVVFRMSLVINVCIVGLPNSGKSTLLAAISAARPKIADYPFTTTEPILGIVDDGARKLIWAELPGLAVGPQGEKGLGNRFLIHARRAQVILYLADATLPDTAAQVSELRQAVAKFDASLADRKAVVAINKMDLVHDTVELNAAADALRLQGFPVCLISAGLDEGLGQLVAGVHKLAQGESSIIPEAQGPQVVFRPKPVDRRR